MTTEDATASPVAWRFETGGGKWAYSDGPMDPREVHDSGKRYEPLYTRPSAAPVEVADQDAMLAPGNLRIVANRVENRYPHAAAEIREAAAPIERLAAGVAEAERHAAAKIGLITTALHTEQRRTERYLARAEAAERDAERYRWLRDLPSGSPHECVGNMPGDWWDEEIDTRMRLDDAARAPKE
jgi:hypothetical protein